MKLGCAYVPYDILDRLMPCMICHTIYIHEAEEVLLLCYDHAFDDTSSHLGFYRPCRNQTHDTHTVFLYPMLSRYKLCNILLFGFSSDFKMVSIYHFELALLQVEYLEPFEQNRIKVASQDPENFVLLKAVKVDWCRLCCTLVCS